MSVYIDDMSASATMWHILRTLRHLLEQTQAGRESGREGDFDARPRHNIQEEAI